MNQTELYEKGCSLAVQLIEGTNTYLSTDNQLKAKIADYKDEREIHQGLTQLAQYYEQVYMVINIIKSVYNILKDNEQKLSLFKAANAASSTIFTSLLKNYQTLNQKPNISQEIKDLLNHQIYNLLKQNENFTGQIPSPQQSPVQQPLVQKMPQQQQYLPEQVIAHVQQHSPIQNPPIQQSPIQSPIQQSPVLVNQTSLQYQEYPSQQSQILKQQSPTQTYQSSMIQQQPVSQRWPPAYLTQQKKVPMSQQQQQQQQQQTPGYKSQQKEHPIHVPQLKKESPPPSNKQIIQLISTSQFLEGFEKTATEFSMKNNMSMDHVWESMFSYAVPKDHFVWVHENMFNKQFGWEQAKALYLKRFPDNTTMDEQKPIINKSTIFENQNQNDEKKLKSQSYTRISQYAEQLLLLEMKLYESIDDYNKKYLRYCKIAKMDLNDTALFKRYLNSILPQYKSKINIELSDKQHSIYDLTELMSLASGIIKPYENTKKVTLLTPYSHKCQQKDNRKRIYPGEDEISTKRRINI